MLTHRIRILLSLLLLLGVAGIANAAVLTTSQFGAYSNPTGEPLGGGAGYSDIYTAESESITNISTNYAQLAAALAAATPGDVIYIPETATINLTGIDSTNIPAGVTIASNRGQDGSAGGRIFKIRLSTDKTKAQMTAFNSATLNVTGDDIRITGLRIEGPDKLTTDYTAADIGMKYGVLNWGHHNLTVDNNELWGWSWAAVAIRNASVPVSDATVKYNYIHHCQEPTNGYGIAPSDSRAEVIGNVFDYLRHAVTGDGEVGDSYNATYNVYLGHYGGGHIFDVHEGATTVGGLYIFDHNTVLINENFAVRIREKPGVPSLVTWNDFRDNLYQGGKSSPVGQIHGTGNITMTNNLVNGSYWASGTVLVE